MAEPQKSVGKMTGSHKLSIQQLGQMMRNHSLDLMGHLNLHGFTIYLHQYECIGYDDEAKFEKCTTSEERIRVLIEIVSHRGESAYHGFIKALRHSAQQEQGFSTHIHLADLLQGEYDRMLKKMTNTIGGAPAIKPQPSLEKHSSSGDMYLDGSTDDPQLYPLIPAIAPLREISGSPDLDCKDHVNPKLVSQSQIKQTDVPLTTSGDGREKEEKTSTNENKYTRRTSVLPKKYSRTIRCLGSAGVIAVSPLLLIAGITLLAFSIEEFKGQRECKGIGIRYALSIFNMFCGLLCLTIPILLILFILYFNLERTDWKQTLRLLVWLTVIFFLITFILTIGELLFSLIYIVHEVYGMYPEWKKNETLCDGAIFVSSFSLNTVAYSIVFVVLVGLGVYYARKYFKWVTDIKNPGFMRKLLTVLKDL